MAGTESATELSDTVSREAHQRMTDERNDLKAQVVQLSATVTDLSYEDKARRHFTTKGVDDPDWAASIALPSMKSAGTEIGDIGAYLDDTFARLYPSTDAPTPDAASPDDGVPTPDASEPPGFARPSPAADGTKPDTKKYLTSSPEVQALIQANNKEAFEAMDKAGQIEWRATPSGSRPG